MGAGEVLGDGSPVANAGSSINEANRSLGDVGIETHEGDLRVASKSVAASVRTDEHGRQRRVGACFIDERIAALLVGDVAARNRLMNATTGSNSGPRWLRSPMSVNANDPG